MPFFEFPDTNLFIHYRFFREVDWPAQAGEREVTLVLAPVVVSELDKRKYAGTRREKERAQKVLKAIRALGRIDKPVLVRDGVWLMGLVAEPDDAFFVEHRLQRQDQDDRLLASALAFKAGAEASARVVICTADTGLTLKGPTRQMEILELDDSLKLPDEPDETERELEASRRELAAIRTAAPDVRVRFADGPVLEACIQLVGPMDSGAIQRHVGRFRAAHPHVHPTPETIPMPNGGVFKLPSFAGVPGFVTPEEAHAHNKAIDNIRNRYEAYLADWHFQVNAFRRCLELEIVLDNVGAAPADDVDLKLWTDAAGIWRDSLPDVEKPPSVPPPARPYDFLNSVMLPRDDFANLRMRDDPIDGPNLGDDGRDEVQYTVRRAKHHVPCVLPKVYFQFDSDAVVGSFTIRYRLVAANIRTPREGELHVKISLARDAEPPDPSRVFAAK